MLTLVVFSVAECTFGGFNGFSYLHLLVLTLTLTLKLWPKN